jgi:TATA-binding protein-associated factor Taf7
MDLPTIVESFKTVDKKSFYKTADVCQVSKVFSLTVKK